MAHTRAQADKLADALRALPAAEPKRLFNGKAMVTYLAPEIIGLQERGYRLGEIAAALRAGGFQITEATLRTYLGRMKKRRAPRRRRTRPARSISPLVN
jgi:hypothetical protein